MSLGERRGEFKVFFVERDPSSARVAIDSLQAVGYRDCHFFPTTDSALALVRQEMPHVIVFDFADFASDAAKFLDEVSAISAEILVILISTASQGLQGYQLVSRSLAYDVLLKPFASNLELIQKIDRATDRLYFQFESEQLREHYEGVAGRGAGGPDESTPDALTYSATGPVPAPKPVEVARSGFVDLNEALKLLQAETDIEESIFIFMEAVTHALFDVPVLYFKYFPSHLTLLFSRATLLPNEKFRGIGVDLRKEDLKKISKFFADPRRIPEMTSLIKEVFKRDAYSAFAHFDGDEPRGIFVVLDDAKVGDKESKVLTLRRIFELAYRRNVLMKEKHTLDISDGMTGLYNRRHFTKSLGEEIARSRRLLLPVSLLLIDIDKTQALNEKIGFQQTDTILRTIGQLLKKSARTNDVVARIGSDEFACLMPHTPHMGAAVKAERFRRIVESTKIPAFEGLGPITISCGLSEYPTFTSDADSLLHSADEAVAEVKRSGGNKVCLAKIPKGFQKDFEPVAVPETPRRAGENS